MMRSLVYLQSTVYRLRKDVSGGVSAEYSFLITFIAIVATLGMVALAPGIVDMFTAVGERVPDPSAVPPCQRNPLIACPNP